MSAAAGAGRRESQIVPVVFVIDAAVMIVAGTYCVGAITTLQRLHPSHSLMITALSTGSPGISPFLPPTAFVAQISSLLRRPTRPSTTVWRSNSGVLETIIAAKSLLESCDKPINQPEKPQVPRYIIVITETDIETESFVPDTSGLHTEPSWESCAKGLTEGVHSATLFSLISLAYTPTLEQFWTVTSARFPPNLIYNSLNLPGPVTFPLQTPSHAAFLVGFFNIRSNPQASVKRPASTDGSQAALQNKKQKVDITNSPSALVGTLAGIPQVGWNGQSHPQATNPSGPPSTSNPPNPIPVSNATNTQVNNSINGQTVKANPLSAQQEFMSQQRQQILQAQSQNASNGMVWTPEQVKSLPPLTNEETAKVEGMMALIQAQFQSGKMSREEALANMQRVKDSVNTQRLEKAKLLMQQKQRNLQNGQPLDMSSLQSLSQPGQSPDLRSLIWTAIDERGVKREYMVRLVGVPAPPTVANGPRLSISSLPQTLRVHGFLLTDVPRFQEAARQNSLLTCALRLPTLQEWPAEAREPLRTQNNGKTNEDMFARFLKALDARKESAISILGPNNVGMIIIPLLARGHLVGIHFEKTAIPTEFLSEAKARGNTLASAAQEGLVQQMNHPLSQGLPNLTI